MAVDRLFAQPQKQMLAHFAGVLRSPLLAAAVPARTGEITAIFVGPNVAERFELGHQSAVLQPRGLDRHVRPVGSSTPGPARTACEAPTKIEAGQQARTKHVKLLEVSSWSDRPPRHIDEYENGVRRRTLHQLEKN